MTNRIAYLLAVIGSLLAGGIGIDATAEEAGVAIPPNIVTHNVPALPRALGERLARYGHTRSADVYGWQEDALLIGTRFADTNQLHRVRQPLGYREQLSFLSEPLADVFVPQGGAKQHAIISWDVGGSEFDQLFLFNLENGESRMVSDGKSLYAMVLWAPDERSFIYVTTQRNGRNWDIHHQTLDGQTRAILETEEGYWLPLDWSPDGKRVLVLHRVSINVSSVHELDIASGELTLLLGSGVDGREQVSVPLANYDGHRGVVFASDADSEYLTLRRYDLESGETRSLTEDIPWNVEGFAFSPNYDRLMYSYNEGGLSKLGLKSWPSGRDRRLPELPQAIVTSMAFNGAGDKVALGLASPISPADVYVVDLKRTKLERWTRSEAGGLDASQFVGVDLIEYPTFDGREIPAFVYKPEGPGPHPVIVYIHGGPEAQYRPFFSTTMQSFVSEMNVAVVAPNVRGSNGYGKTYLTLDNGKLREDSVKDIGALLDWIATREDLRSDRVAVMGGSYGGYMVLASMVHYGERLAAAVESVGISNFVTFLENTQPYRQDMRRVEYGDERDPDMRAHLEVISPLNHIDNMVTPLLISQGANDPRVPASESEQIRVALEEAGVTAWYILAKDEGHGFRKKVNRDYDRVAKFAFLEQYLNRD